jgi:arylsulfatase A-like enzyme
MQGQDISDAIVSNSKSQPDSAFFQIFGPYNTNPINAGWRGVRTSRYMYARTKEKPWVLYDLQEDPHELNNLVDDPSAQAIRASMEKRLQEWMQRTGDSWDYNWSFPVEHKGRLYRGKAFYSVEEFMEWRKANPGGD